MNLPIALLLALFGGFVVGILTNLIADYAPARRLHFEAARSPFVSRTAIPPIPSFFPAAAPLFWSGWIALFAHKQPFAVPRWRRRLFVEALLPLLYAWITLTYVGAPRLPFLLLYAPLLLLIAIIDIERRWVLNSVLAVTAAVAIFDVWIIAPDSIPTALRGALFGFLIMFGLWFLGLVFGQGVGALRGRGVGRTVLGFGDVRLATVGGLLLGWPGMGFALLIMVFTGAVGAVSVLFGQVRRKRRLRLFSAIPYAPYIALGIGIVLYLPWLIGSFVLAVWR